MFTRYNERRRDITIDIGITASNVTIQQHVCCSAMFLLIILRREFTSEKSVNVAEKFKVLLSDVRKRNCPLPQVSDSIAHVFITYDTFPSQNSFVATTIEEIRIIHVPMDRTTVVRQGFTRKYTPLPRRTNEKREISIKCDGEKKKYNTILF